MLSKERLEEIANEFERVIYPAEVGEMARELLSLHALPEMAEVDAIAQVVYQKLTDPEYSTIDLEDAFDKMTAIARRAIASAHAQKTRADEARKCCPCNCHDQPSSEEAMGLKEHENCGLCAKALMEESASLEEAAYKMFNEQIATLTTERDEARRLLKSVYLSAIRNDESLKDPSVLRFGTTSRNLAELLMEVHKLCKGGRDDT